MTFAEKVQAAKQKIKIPDIWERLGFPGEPRKLGKSPWRPDKHPSFSVFSNGDMFKDQSTGETGDVIIFLEKSCGLSRKDAMHQLVSIAFGNHVGELKAEDLPILERETPLKNGRLKPQFPAIFVGADWQYEQLSKLRSIPISSLRYANSLGLLWFGRVMGHDAWIVTDSTGANGQARKLNGEVWRFKLRTGEIVEPKSYTFPNAWAGWPLGAPGLAKGKNVHLCEGGPDLLADCLFAEKDESIVPVGMLGGAQVIHPGALPMFYQTNVTIFMHNEKPKPRMVAGKMFTPKLSSGQESAKRWWLQLKPIVKSIKVYRFPEGIKDLNDYIKEFDAL